jgi:hypothetical protein
MNNKHRSYRSEIHNSFRLLNYERSRATVSMKYLPFHGHVDATQENSTSVDVRCGAILGSLDGRKRDSSPRHHPSPMFLRVAGNYTRFRVGSSCEAGSHRTVTPIFAPYQQQCHPRPSSSPRSMSCSRIRRIRSPQRLRCHERQARSLGSCQDMQPETRILQKWSSSTPESARSSLDS